MNCRGGQSGRFNAEPAIAAELRLAGTGADPQLTGTIIAEGLRLGALTTDLAIDHATVTFRDGFPRDPSLDLRARSELLGKSFSAWVSGPLSHPVRVFDCEPPLTPEHVRASLQARSSDAPATSDAAAAAVNRLSSMIGFSLRDPAASLLHDVRVFEGSIADNAAGDSDAPATNASAEPGESASRP